MTDLRLRDVVAAEIEQLELYGEAAQEFFLRLSDEIRSEFSASLTEVANSEMKNFQSQIGMSETSGDFLGGQEMLGDIFSSAINSAIRTSIRDYIRNGSVDLTKVLRAADRSGAAVLNRQTTLNLSSSQQHADAFSALTRSQRNS